MPSSDSGTQRGEVARAAIALLDEHGLRVGQIADDLVVAAYDFARRAVERLELLELAAGRVHEMDDAGSLDLVAVLVDDGAAVVQLARGRRHLLQPGEAFARECRCRRRVQTPATPAIRRARAADAARRPIVHSLAPFARAASPRRCGCRARGPGSRCSARSLVRQQVLVHAALARHARELLLRGGHGGYRRAGRQAGLSRPAAGESGLQKATHATSAAAESEAAADMRVGRHAARPALRRRGASTVGSAASCACKRSLRTRGRRTRLAAQRVADQVKVVPALARASASVFRRCDLGVRPRASSSSPSINADILSITISCLCGVPSSGLSLSAIASRARNILRSHRADRTIHDIRDVLVAQPFDLAQRDRGS